MTGSTRLQNGHVIGLTHDILSDFLQFILTAPLGMHPYETCMSLSYSMSCIFSKRGNSGLCLVVVKSLFYDHMMH